LIIKQILKDKMDNNITLSLDVSTIDNLYKETKISKKLLTIGNLINNLIADNQWINEVRQEIKYNRKKLVDLKNRLSWEKEIIRSSGTYVQTNSDHVINHIETEIWNIKNQNEFNRNHIKEMKEVIKRRKEKLKELI